MTVRIRIWHTARCKDCDGPQMEFYTKQARDTWAEQHGLTGHMVEIGEIER